MACHGNTQCLQIPLLSDVIFRCALSCLYRQFADYNRRTRCVGCVILATPPIHLSVFPNPDDYARSALTRFDMGMPYIL